MTKPATRRAVPWLHMRGQFSYHGEALVTGTTAGLTALRDAINQALEQREGEAVVFATDGEGYAVTVRRSATVRDMGAPLYLDEIARAIATVELDFVRKHERRNRNVWLEKHNADVAGMITNVGDAGDAEIARLNPREQEA